MPNIKSSIKRARNEKKANLRNHAIKSRVRRFVVAARNEIAAHPSEPQTIEAVRLAISELDKGVSKGVLHRNNASRRKSHLVHRMKKMQEATHS